MIRIAWKYTSINGRVVRWSWVRLRLPGFWEQKFPKKDGESNERN